MKCSISECHGAYERKLIIHPVRHKGQVMVIDGVPAEVCTVCGDVLLTAQTVRRIEELLQSTARPTRLAPLYEYA